MAHDERHDAGPARLAKDLVAASAVPLVLAILEEGESYGYAILRRVSAVSGGRMHWTEGMLYPVLHRLEERGCIRSRSVASEAGPPRKVYALHRDGKRLLEETRRQWQLVNETLEAAWALRRA
jgi:PadR family transcriptional regulator, regulatory protein PadR